MGGDTDIFFLEAPLYPALLRDAALRHKEELLAQWGLPGRHFPLCTPDASSCTGFINSGKRSLHFDLCLKKLVVWIQIWLASDEDLHFLTGFPQSFSPAEAPLWVASSPSSDNLDLSVENNSHTKRTVNGSNKSVSDDPPPSPCSILSPTSTRLALVEARHILGKSERSKEYKSVEVIKVIRLWREAITKMHQNLVELYHPLRLNTAKSQRAINQPGSLQYRLLQSRCRNTLKTEFHPAVTPAVSESGGAGVFVKQGCIIEADTILAQVDPINCLSVYTAFSDPEFGAVAWYALSQSLDCIDEDILLMLFIIFDFWVRQKNSPRFEYYASLPPEDDTITHNLLLAPPEVLEFLDIVELTDAVESLRLRLYHAFEWSSEVLFPKFPTIFASNVFTWTRFLYARMLIDTRGFAIHVESPMATFLANFGLVQHVPTSTRGDAGMSAQGGQASITSPQHQKDDHVWVQRDVGTLMEGKCRGPQRVAINHRVTYMIPGMDLFNHHPVAAVCRPPSFDSVLKKMVIRNECAVRPLDGDAFEAPTEIFLSYGPCETWQLLFHYGFCPSPRVTTSDAHLSKVLPADNLDTICVQLPTNQNTNDGENVEASQFFLRDPASAFPPFHSTFASTIAQLFEKESPGEAYEQALEAFLEPIVEKIAQLQSYESCETPPHWFFDWGPRMLQFFECRRDFFLRHLEQTSQFAHEGTSP